MNADPACPGFSVPLSLNKLPPICVTLLTDRWREGLPGVRKLAADLGVSHDSVRAAFHFLEAEGALRPNGEGRRREAATVRRRGRRTLRIGNLLQLRLSEQNSEIQRTLARLQHDLEVAGHI